MSGTGHREDACGQSRAFRIAGMLFPFVLWFIATFYLAGDIGKYSDDWSLDLRRPDTGVYHWPDSPFERWDYFWRPLHLALIHGLGTFAWEADWLRHLLNAGLHGAVVVLLYRFMRTVRVSRPIAAAGALIALTHPIVYEMVLWPSTVSAMVASVMLLLMWTRAWKIGQGTHAPKRGWVVPLAWGAWTFVMACFYEQQAGVAPLCGVLVFAAMCTQWEWATIRRAAGRAVLFGIGPALACIVYMGLLVSTAPRDTRGGSNNFKGVTESIESLWACASRVMDWIAGARIVDAIGGSMVTAKPLLLAWPGLCALGIATIAGLAWWVVWFVRVDRKTGDACATSGAGLKNDANTGANGTAAHMRGWSGRDVVLLLTLLCAAVLAMVPTALIAKAPPQPRLVYLPLHCLILCAAVACDRSVRAWVPTRFARAMRWPAGLAVVCAAVFFACTLVGYQQAFRVRGHGDLDCLAQLKALVPDPAPGTVFVPVRLDPRATRTGHPRFDNALPGAANLAWASWAWLQGRDGYMRRDIFCTNVREGTAPTYREATEAGFRYSPNWATPPPYVRRGGQFIEWSVCIPFAVDEQHTVRLVETLNVPAAGTKRGEAMTIRFPQVLRLRDRLDVDKFVRATLTGIPAESTRNP